MVDLSVALEAALLDGDEHEEISLRLRNRAAFLIATDTDPADTVYHDVKVLYGLRSAVVHGSSLTAKEIQKQINRISVTSRTTMAGIKGALALDRMRDIVRRAILARGFLDEAGIWPLRGVRSDVDRSLVNEHERQRWRTAWQVPLRDIGLENAAREGVLASLEFGADREAQPSPENGSVPPVEAT